jgi:type III pantothenate kinase
MSAGALLLDIGNTRLKWALLAPRATVAQAAARRRAGFVAVGALALDSRRRTLPGRGATLGRFFARLPAAVPLIGCNVAGPAIERQISALARRAGREPPHWVRSAASAAGVRSAYRDPWRLGVDRWVALIGAHATYPGRALCIASVGTALTIDLLDAQGRHHGGLIAPGPTLMIDALLERTAGIRRRAGNGAVAGDLGAGRAVFWARDTRGGLRAGARQAVAALIAHAPGAARARLGRRPTLLVTGGGAATVRSLLRSPVRYEPDLVLHGLAVLACSGAAPFA